MGRRRRFSVYREQGAGAACGRAVKGEGEGSIYESGPVLSGTNRLGIIGEGEDSIDL